MATQVGIIIGRFQVDDLHPAHRAVIDEVKDRHDSILIFLGVPATFLSQRNPLDFATRRRMIQSHYPDIEVLAIQDTKLDRNWYQELDRRIREVEPHANVTLYGGRDSFIDHYDGQFETVELDIENSFSGTEIRERVGRNPLHTQDFRAGVIYAIANRHSLNHLTVDMALLRDPSNSPTKKWQILLGKKHEDNKWCFPGGFVDTKDPTLESAANRELFEETGFHTSGATDSRRYVLSMEISNDWRYAHEVDRVLTTLFEYQIPIGSMYNMNNGEGLEETGLHAPQELKAGDDLAEIQWYDLDHFSDAEHHFATGETMTLSHAPLMRAYIRHLKLNNLYGFEAKDVYGD